MSSVVHRVDWAETQMPPGLDHSLLHLWHGQYIVCKINNKQTIGKRFNKVVEHKSILSYITW